MSAPSEAERLWREAHRECAFVNEPENKDRSRDRARRHHAAIDAAVRAAFEEGVHWDFRNHPLPPWLPAGAKEDKP